MLPKGFRTATVVDRVDFAEDLATFRLRPEEPLTFEPGQYATLALEIDGVFVKRAYSILSAPHEADLEFYIECVREGVLTPCLWELQPGRELFIRKKIVGHFTLDRSRRCHVMAATVTGLAPFLSIVRHQVHALANGGPASDDGEPFRFLILHGASHADELGPYREECTALAERYDWLHYVPTVSRPWSDESWTGETGRVEDVTRKWMDRLGFGPAEMAGYACGNPDMIDTVKGIFKRARLGADAIHEEKYFTTPAAGTAPTAQPAAVEAQHAASPKEPPKGRKPPPGALKLKAVKAPPSP
jgi:ferredoxin--NADP+ reductase